MYHGMPRWLAFYRTVAKAACVFFASSVQHKGSRHAGREAERGPPLL